ncbi:MAG: PDZ domain-containing protein [Woeseia sp.]
MQQNLRGRVEAAFFASGRPNRVAVRTVIETSPAEQAGLQPGDVIRSYAGARVFSSEQLVNLRSAGVKGMPVTVEIVRDGELMQITMPRGPMGIQTRQDVVDPSAPGGG